MLVVKNAKFIKFLIVGIINTCFGYLIIFLLLNIINAGYFTSTLIGYSIGSIVSFLLNRQYTFRHQGNLFHVYYKYCIVFLLSYLISYVSGKLLINLLSAYVFPHRNNNLTIENIGVVFGSIVYVGANYFGNCKFTFNQKL